MENNFAVFIISHGRPNDLHTIKMLQKYNYTGRYYIVIDNEDKQSAEYYKKHNEIVIMFDKIDIAKKVDNCNNFNNRRTTTHARNACFEIAEKLNVTYFLVLDDDYTVFRYRWIDKYITKGYVMNFDRLFKSLLKYYVSTPFKSIALAQGGDFIGGESCGLIQNYLYNSRKCMNSFFCSTERSFKFIGQLNEDVNTYVSLGSKGDLFITLPFVGLEQKATQLTAGGMTEAYKKYGTYIKSFTTVLIKPDSVKVAMMGFTEQRLHHRIKWINTTPMIIDEKHRK